MKIELIPSDKQGSMPCAVVLTDELGQEYFYRPAPVPATIHIESMCAADVVSRHDSIASAVATALRKNHSLVHDIRRIVAADPLAPTPASQVASELSMSKVKRHPLEERIREMARDEIADSPACDGKILRQIVRDEIVQMIAKLTTGGKLLPATAEVSSPRSLL